MEYTKTFHARSSIAGVVAGIAIALLAGCAGPPTTVVMKGPAPQQVQTTPVPKGTFLGGASAGEATALARMVATSNNNTLQAFERVGGQINRLQATGPIPPRHRGLLTPIPMSSEPLKLLACIAMTALAVAGCGGKDDAITQAAKKDVAAGVPAPSLAEIKSIAEESFVDGLPIVMNYAVMHQYVIGRDSGQFKAPFNTIYNEHRVFTYEDTAIPTPNSDPPHSLAWMDLRAEPMVISVPADRKRYDPVMLNDGNPFNYGDIGSPATGNEAGSYLIDGPRWKGGTPPGIRKTCQSTTDFSMAVFRTQLFDDLDFALQFAPPRPDEEAIRGRLASIGIGPGGRFPFKDLSAGQGQGVEPAARARRPDRPGDAPVLAQDRAAFRSSGGRRDLAPAGARPGRLASVDET